MSEAIERSVFNELKQWGVYLAGPSGWDAAATAPYPKVVRWYLV
jgi:hypothetical protein